MQELRRRRTLHKIKGKQFTNMLNSGTDSKENNASAVKFILEEWMEYIVVDENLEVTPENLGMRKILLDENDRKKAGKSIEAYS